ncbi:MAG: Hsp20/alpha crystallin family protein [Thermoplasmata archaeon]|nr:Hsp20/alpha crystallin family protein [Euryarchaeota archaeon]RLF67320.1 MAG: Hsp20/alpha crystallin family protein [Thermoplasmata archaeon]
MAWWPRKRRRRWDPWEPYGFEDIFEELMEEMTLIDEYFNKIFYDLRRRFEEMARTGSPKSVVYGFTISIGPDGKPRIETFGNVPRQVMPRGITEEQLEEEREPLVEIVEDKDKVYVTVELPGVDKDKIDLEVMDGNKLLIKAEGENRKYKKVLELPADVDPDSIKATYKNGILDIIIKKKGSEKRSGKKIKIE